MAAEEGEGGFSRLSARALRLLSHQSSGGEGVLRVVQHHERRKRWCGSDGYWLQATLAVQGRGIPLLPYLLYCAYCAAVVTLIITLKDGYTQVPVLKDLRTPVTAIGLALFLLLAFRTNLAYDRWWEGRKLVDTMQARSQNMCRISAAVIAPASPALAFQMMSWARAFFVAAKCVLRKAKDLSELRDIMDEAILHQIQAAPNMPAYCLINITRIVEQARRAGLLDRAFVLNLDDDVRRLAGTLNSCLRIAQTPMPHCYLAHLRSFICIWLMALPVAWITTLQYTSIPVSCVVGLAILGFEGMAAEIENPFGRDYNDLPLDAIAASLKANVRAMMTMGGVQQQQQLAQQLWDAVPAAPGAYLGFALPKEPATLLDSVMSDAVLTKDMDTSTVDI